MQKSKMEDHQMKNPHMKKKITTWMIDRISPKMGLSLPLFDNISTRNGDGCVPTPKGCVPTPKGCIPTLVDK